MFKFFKSRTEKKTTPPNDAKDVHPLRQKDIFEFFEEPLLSEAEWKKFIPRFEKEIENFLEDMQEALGLDFLSAYDFSVSKIGGSLEGDKSVFNCNVRAVHRRGEILDFESSLIGMGASLDEAIDDLFERFSRSRLPLLIDLFVSERKSGVTLTRLAGDSLNMGDQGIIWQALQALPSLDESVPAFLRVNLFSQSDGVCKASVFRHDDKDEALSEGLSSWASTLAVGEGFRLEQSIYLHGNEET